MIYNKICELCRKPFITKHRQERYCKKEHYVKCAVCNKPILLKTSTDKANYLKKGFRTCSQKCAKIHMLETNKNKYGYDTPFSNKDVQDKIRSIQQTEEYKNKISKSISKARKNISKDKYKEIYEKTKQTNLKKYNIKCTLQLPKSRETMLKKYGAEYTGSSNELKQKMIKTNLERYGTPYPVINTVQLNKSIHDIIDNKKAFKNYILQIPFDLRTQTNIAKQLQISVSYISSLLNKYNLNNLINHFSSNFEQDVKKFLNILNKPYINNVRNIIYPYELDIYIPDKKVAIECNGTYYHSNKINKDKNYHYMKSKLCEEKGIRLIHIYEYEWFNERQRPILESIIKNALGITEHIIYARQCKIEIKQSREMKQFFNDNNIQGFRGGSFSICLVDKKTKEIYMAYMFGKAFFGKGKYEWEVIRGATKLNYSVIGGASKIWNYFIKNYNPKSIVYYIDYNYFNGNSLPYLGLKYVKTQPSFKNYFVKEKIVKNRDPMHHKDIVKGYEDGSILQIWNAGTKVYVWENN